MKARYCTALSALAAGLVASAPVAPLMAQVTRSADPNAPRLVVEVFRSSDKNAGVQVADAVRTRISQDVSLKQLWVLPKQDITSNLEASGFPTTEALNMNDARALAQLLRGDMFIIGQVVKDTAGYRVDAQYVLTRDASLVQPLVSTHVNKPDQAAGAISREFQNAQKAFQGERNCVNAARDQKFDVAKAEAQKAIAAYPNSTLARICLANVLVTQKAPPDQVLAVTNEILRIDPRSKPGLTVAYQALKDAGKNAEATDVLLRLVGADPTNSKLVEQVVNEFAIGGQAAKAIPFVDQLVRDNPGDPSYLSLQMRVHLAAKDYKGGIAAGQELLKADTAAATPDLFNRLSAAAQIDSQPQLAAQLMAQAVAKFPNNADLLSNYVDILRGAGQNQQALEILNKLVAANPKAAGVNLSRARIFMDMNQPDSALSSLKSALTAGDSAAVVARYAVQLGNVAYRAASASKAMSDYERAVTFLDFANTTSATPEGQFLLGATQFAIGASLLQEVNKLARGTAAEKRQGCDIAKRTQTAFNGAQINLPAGGKFQPQATQQLLTQLGQYAPYADQFAKALCK